jgi:hypothetical protein
MLRSGVSGGIVVTGFAALFGVVAVGCGSSSSGDPPGGPAPDGGVGPGNPQATITVDATMNAMLVGGCGAAPALLSNVAAGTYTMALSASTLTKGGASGMTPPAPSVDNYVIVNVPLPPGDPHEDHRFFMLNGLGATASITLPAVETLQVFFVDSDTVNNTGTGTVTLSPGGATATVDAVANDLAYDDGCHSTPATMRVASGGTFRVTLLDSTLSSGNGARDDFVLVRTPSEAPMNDTRYVILNGVGASATFTPFNSNTVRVWYIGATPGTGTAHVQVSQVQ